GIQARSGCFCAGPYLHRRFPIDRASSAWMDRQSAAGCLGAKLSLVRLGFHYFTGEDVFEYVLAAVHFLADEAWELLPLYRFDPESGLWQHREHRPAPVRLADLSLPAERIDPGTFASHLEAARRVVAAVEAEPPPAALGDLPLSAGFERGRWFPLP